MPSASDKILCEVLNWPPLDMDLDDYLRLPAVRRLLEAHFSLDDDVPPGQNGLALRRRERSARSSGEGVKFFTRKNRSQPSPLILSVKTGLPVDLHDRHTQVSAFAPGLSAHECSPLWQCHNEQELARSRPAFGSHMPGAQDVVGFAPEEFQESCAFIRALHGCRTGVDLPPAGASVSQCNLWHMLSTALVFPGDKAIFCTLCRTTMKLSPGWTGYVRQGWLAPLADMDWPQALRRYTKHLEWENCHHADECTIEADPSRNRYNNVYPLVVIVDPALKGRRAAEVVTSGPAALPVDSFPGAMRQVIVELRRFYLERSRLPISPKPEGFGMFGAYIQPNLGRLIVYQRMRHWAPADFQGAVFTLDDNKSPFDDRLGLALLKRAVELEELEHGSSSRVGVEPERDVVHWGGTQLSDGATLTRRPQSQDGATHTRRPQSQDGATNSGRPQSQDGSSHTGRPQSRDGATHTGRPQSQDGATHTGRPQSQDGATHTGRPQSPDGATHARRPQSRDGSAPKISSQAPGDATYMRRPPSPVGGMPMGRPQAPDGPTYMRRPLSPVGRMPMGRPQAPDGPTYMRRPLSPVGRMPMGRPQAPDGAVYMRRPLSPVGGMPMGRPQAPDGAIYMRRPLSPVGGMSMGRPQAPDGATYMRRPLSPVGGMSMGRPQAPDGATYMRRALSPMPMGRPQAPDGPTYMRRPLSPVGRMPMESPQEPDGAVYMRRPLSPVAARPMGRSRSPDGTACMRRPLSPVSAANLRRPQSLADAMPMGRPKDSGYSPGSTQELESLPGSIELSNTFQQRLESAPEEEFSERLRQCRGDEVDARSGGGEVQEGEVGSSRLGCNQENFFKVLENAPEEGIDQKRRTMEGKPDGSHLGKLLEQERHIDDPVLHRTGGMRGGASHPPARASSLANRPEQSSAPISEPCGGTSVREMEVPRTASPKTSDADVPRPASYDKQEHGVAIADSGGTSRRAANGWWSTLEGVSFTVDDLKEAMGTSYPAPQRLCHEPLKSITAKPTKLYEILPRTHFKDAQANRAARRPQMEIGRFNYDYLLHPSYLEPGISSGCREYYTSCYNDGLMCQVDFDEFNSFNHPVVYGLLHRDIRHEVGGTVAFGSGLFSGTQSRRVPLAGTVLHWLVQNRTPVLYCVILTDLKVESSNPQNSCYLGFCCRRHLEASLPRMKRYSVRCPLRSANSSMHEPSHNTPFPSSRSNNSTAPPMPVTIFFGRALAAFNSTIYEKVQGEARQSGITAGEAMLNRFIMLLVEHLQTGRPMPRGLKILQKWHLTSQELQPFTINDNGYNHLQVSTREFQRANRSWRVSHCLPGLHHSLRHPLDLGDCYSTRTM